MNVHHLCQLIHLERARERRNMPKRYSAIKRSRKNKRDRSDNRVYFYNGSDPRTKLITCMNPNCRCRNRNRSKKHTSSFHKNDDVTCPGGCETFRYCSTTCAQQNTGHPAMQCEKLRNLRSDVKLLSQNVDVMLALADPANFGNISRRRHPAAFTYLVTRSNLANELVTVARENHIGLIWNEATAIMQDNLRLSHFHLKDKPIKAWCYQFATCLLDAGRLDDVLSFTAYLIHLGSSSNTFFDGSLDGDWIYPRYYNQPCLSKQWQQGDLYLVFVMFVAKLKQITACTLAKQMIYLFRATGCFRMIEGLEGPLGIILEYLIPCQIGPMVTWGSFEQSYEDLSCEVSCMSKILVERNPYLLEEIKTLRSQSSRKEIGSKTDQHWKFHTDSNEFAHACVENCSYSLLSIPDLEFWII